MQTEQIKTKWDYSNLAKHYDKRAEYAEAAVKEFLTVLNIPAGSLVADIGAGTGKLTKRLLQQGLKVRAVEPNAEMRKFGTKNTENQDVQWSVGTAENTGLPAGIFQMATFGSSFNVTDRDLALKEVKRITVPQGGFACLWNHRVLTDAFQTKIEETIASMVSGYEYGTRREDQMDYLNSTGLFEKVYATEKPFSIQMPATDCLEAWKSHATLQRQAGDKFEAVISAIRELLKGKTLVEVPYKTVVWYAKLK